MSLELSARQWRPAFYWHFLNKEECLAWPTERPVPELLDELVNHRLLDLLGTLAMIDHRRLPAGRVVSIRGGHALDVQLITKNPAT